MVTDCVCACGDKRLHAGTISFGLYLRRLQETMHLLALSARSLFLWGLMARCSGTTRAGRQCSITATSTMTDDMGRLVAQPLRCGGKFCVLHAKPFVVRPAPVTEAMVLVFLDLELRA